MKSRDAITSKNIHLWVTYNRLSWVKTRDAIASKNNINFAQSLK